MIASVPDICIFLLFLALRLLTAKMSEMGESGKLQIVSPTYQTRF